jgi:hypothetical protein
MSIRTLLIACCGLLIPGSASLNAQCTAETETGRRIVRGYAAHDVTTGPDGRLVLIENQVRPLADPGDSSVCQQLFNVWWAQWRTPDEAKPDWAWTYYQVGDLYYVVAHKTTPPVHQNPDGTLRISLRWSPLFIFDRNFQLLRTIAS